jgi:hypothetical protein
MAVVSRVVSRPRSGVVVFAQSLANRLRRGITVSAVTSSGFRI